MNDANAQANDKTTLDPYPSPAQAWWAVSVLMLFYVFSFIDRQIIALLVGPMKRDLGVTDTQVGLMSGLAFALLYTFLGLPIGRMADRFPRKAIIAAGVFVWSIMATACGLARTALQLFLARVGVGVGEAALSPAAYSMITDLFPRHKQGAPFSVYNLGITVGSGLALLIGGTVARAVFGAGLTYDLPILGEVRAWQFVFIATGLPGVFLPLLLLTIREPKRRGLLQTDTTTASGKPAQRIPMSEVLRYVGKNWEFYTLHTTAMALMAMVGYGVGQWLPETISRTYGVTTGEVGQVLGISTMVVNTSGVLLAGILCDRLYRKGYKDAPIVVSMLVAATVALTSPLSPFMPTTGSMWVMLVAAGLPFHGYVAMGPMVINQVTPNQLRAQVSAMYLFVVNLLGLGFGPFIVPFISDHILHDPQKIRYALGIVVFGGCTLSALLSWLVRGLFRERMAASAEWR